MSLNTTIGLNPLTSTTIRSIVDNSTQSSFNSTTTFNQTTITIYPDGVYNFTWTYSPPIYIPPNSGVYDGSYYSISLYSYIIVLVIVIVTAIIAKLALQRRQALTRAAVARTRARQQNVTVSTISTSQQQHNEAGNNVGVPKDSDLPPAYDDVIKTYLNAKMELEAEEGAVGGVIIETELDTMTSTSVVDSTTTAVVIGARNETMTIAPATTTTVITCPEPPSYESTLSISRDSIV